MSRHFTPPPPAARPSAPPQAKSSADDELLYHDFAEISQRVAKRPLVLFFGRGTFSDNTKYLFLATTKAATGCEVVWCSFNKPLVADLRAHGLRSFDLTADGKQTCNLLLDASVAVFCENPGAALGLSTVFSGCLAGAQKIQLWHGVSVKHLDLMTIPHLEIRDADFRRQLRFAGRVDHFLSTSSQLDAFWIRASGCTSLVRAGQPRNEVVVRPATGSEMIGAELPPEQAELLHSKAKWKLLLTPTWQRGAPLHITTPVYYQALARWAAANDGVVFVKQHPFLQRSGVPTNIGNRVFFLGAGVDVYPWMPKFDALITDYSSIMFDYLLLNRPIFTFNTRTEVAYGFEPDYSLIPEGEFRYEFDAGNFEAVLEKNLADHPLAPAQRTLGGQLFETPAAAACAQLVQLIRDCSDAAVDKNFTVTTPKLPAHLTRIAV
jgi:CDP-glycerol glycerophosphotransferase (TagB/SpsB family)